MHPGRERTRELLNELDEFFASEETSFYDKQELWSVLSALRGPDDNRGKEVTIKIRAAAFPKTMMMLFKKHPSEHNSMNEFGAEFAKPHEVYMRHSEVEIQYQHYEKDRALFHFVDHAKWAIATLHDIGLAQLPPEPTEKED